MKRSLSNTLRTSLFALGFTVLGASSALTFQAQAQGVSDGGTNTVQQLPGVGKKAHLKQRKGGKGGKNGSMNQIRMLTQNLDLTDDQRATLKAIGKDYRGNRKSKKAERISDIESLRVILESDNVNRRSVHKLIDERLEARAQEVHDTTDQLLDFVETLDADQRMVLSEELLQMQTQVEERGNKERKSWGPPEGSGPVD